jgi:hypothetical protein
MSNKTLIGIILVVIGTVVLAYSGISVNTPGKPIEFLGVHVAMTRSHFIPPAVGGVILAAGFVLLFLKARRI